MIDGFTRAGFIALLGAPNVGKSTLINELVGTKVSIVSPKTQTTRTKVMGICITDEAQIIFIDTPGIFKPRRRLDRAMVAAAWHGAGNADHILLLMDATRGIDSATRAIIYDMKQNKQKGILAINKIDIVKKPKLLSITDEVKSFDLFDQIFMISAIKGDGIDSLLNRLKELMPEGPWLFPENQVSNMPERMLAAEITREKLFMQLHNELPYATTVETDSWEHKSDQSIRISQIIYVERDTQKPIVIGKGGRLIKHIGAQARKELEQILGTSVHLFIFVKVRAKWGEDRQFYRDWDLDFNA